MDQTYAYLAGFFDGEGTIGIAQTRSAQGRRRWMLRISVSQVYPSPLALLADTFGGRVHKSGRNGRRPVYGWLASSRLAYLALKAMRPYLLVKALQADIALEFQESIYARDVPHWVLLTEQEEAFREGCRLRLKAAKSVDVDEVHDVGIRLSASSVKRKRPTFDVLRSYYEGHGLKQTAEHFGAHQQTVMRWLALDGTPRVGARVYRSQL